MTDFADIGIRMDSRPVAEGTKALDALAASAAAMEPKVDSATKAAGALVEASANVWRRGGDATKAVDALGEATVRTGQRTAATNGQMSDTSRIMAAQAQAARDAAAASGALGNSSAQLTLGQQHLNDKFKEQAATIGMSRSQLMAYQAAQMGLTSQTQQAIATVKAHEDAIRAATKAKEDAAKSANQLHDTLGLLAKAYAALKVAEYIKDSALLAARYETLGVVIEVVGRNAGYTKTQMLTATDAIARQGITMVESRESATKLVQAHVDLKNATVLARIAQDAAVIGHLNSSDAFDRLVNGISRGNVLILRNIGINVNLQTAYREMADQLGKSTKELTENERVQARLNAVIERGSDIAGTYEAAMGTAGKQITSMQRYTQDLKTTFGEVFNEALTVSVMALTNHLKDSNKEISELSKNNQLEEWGHGITAIFTNLANTVSNAYTSIQKFDTFARHMDARKAIGADFDAQSKANSDAGAPWGDKSIYEREQKIEARRKAALAQEAVDYLTQQNTLSGQFDRFAKAQEERNATRAVKRKADAEAQLKVDEDYAAKATALLIANANKGVEVQQAAQMALYKSIYVGTPTYRDTEGREAKEKIDQAENTRMADHLKRLETEAAAEKASAEFMMRIDEMRHKAGEMGDETFYERRRGYANEIAGAEIAGYNKQLVELRKHHNNTKVEAENNAKAIHDVEDKLSAARAKFSYDDLIRDEEKRQRQKAIESASTDAMNKYLSDLDKEARKLEESNAGHEMTRGALERETVARLDLAIANQKQLIENQSIGGAALAEIERAPIILKYLEDQRVARERLAKGFDQQDWDRYNKKMADQAIQDWQRAGTSIADSLTNAFGAGGKALGGMFKAYSEGVAGQLRAQRDLAAAKKLSEDSPEKVEAINRAQLNGAQAQLKSYGDMADAAQGFFDAGSRGYEAMGAAAKVMHAAEVALSLVKGVNAVLTQGEGDPYSAFARMAAMAAVVVGLGVAISGGGGSGGGQSAAEVQKTQGTGSVFGDSSAKSDSIARSIALATANSSIELTHTAGMLAALKNIEASMSGLTNLIVRTTGVTDGSNMGIQTGTLSQGPGGFMGKVTNLLSQIPLVGGLLGGLSNLWGKTTQNVVDSGLQFGGSVNDLQSGRGYSQYASVDTTKSSWFGLSKSTSNSVQTAGLSSELSSQFGLIFTNLEGALRAAAVGIGGNAADVSRALDGLTISTTKISLKGLTGDALTSAINGVISKTMDQMAEAAFPAFDKFRKVGEGYAETVLRVTTNYANVGSIFEAMGKSLITTANTTTIAVGDVVGGWMGRLINGVIGGVSAALPKVSTLSIDARERLIDLAGGIDKMASQATSFASNFLSEAERLAPATKYVSDEMAKLGYSSISSREQFKNLVLGIDASTQKGAEQYTALMALADAFARTHAATVDLTKSTQEIADERKGLQDQIDQLTMTSTQLRAKERLGIDASNRALLDQLAARRDIATAYERESSALKSMADSMKSAQAGTLAYKDSLSMGSLSVLTPMEKAMEAQRQYEASVAKVKADPTDSAAYSAAQAAATALLTASQVINSSDATYAAVLAKVQADMGLIAGIAGAQMTDAQLQLSVMDKSYGELVTLNETMLSFKDALFNFNALGTPPAVLMPAPVLNYSTMGTANTEALVAEVKALRTELLAEIKGRREDAQRQTGDLLEGNYDANGQVGTMISSVVAEAVEKSTWAARNRKAAIEE